jgi:hypothetical protein
MWTNYSRVTTRCRDSLPRCDLGRKPFPETCLEVCIAAGQGLAAARRDTPKLVLVGLV